MFAIHILLSSHIAIYCFNHTYFLNIFYIIFCIFTFCLANATLLFCIQYAFTIEQCACIKRKRPLYKKKRGTKKICSTESNA